jgi:hypothetical protein
MSIENPHLLTQSQFVEQCTVTVHRPADKRVVSLMSMRRHKGFVAAALKRGESVPAEVLVAYPELRKAVTAK